MYQYLAQIGWFPAKRNCPECEGIMVINRKEDEIDGVIWKCNNKTWKRKKKPVEHEFRFVTEHGLRIRN